MSERQIRKYMSLDKLIPELTQAFDDEIINIETASKIATLGETEQLFLVDILNESGKIVQDDIDAAKLLQEQKETAQKTIESKENEIAILEEMKESAGSQEDVEMIASKIESRKQDINETKQGLSRKELDHTRKLSKANKALDQITESINKLQKVLPYVKDDTTITLRLEMMQMKLNNLLK